MTPYFPPEAVVRLVYRDSYPELRDSRRFKAHHPAAERRRLRPGSLGAILARLPRPGVTGTVAGLAARLNLARGH